MPDSKKKELRGNGEGKLPLAHIPHRGRFPFYPPAGTSPREIVRRVVERDKPTSESSSVGSYRDAMRNGIKRLRSTMTNPSERLKQEQKRLREEQDLDLEYEIRDIVEKDKRLDFPKQVKVVDAVMRRKEEILPWKQNLKDLIAEEAERALR